MRAITRFLTLSLMLVLVLPAGTAAQESHNNEDLRRLTDQLQAALNANDWKKASELSAALRIAMTEARNHSFAQGTTKQVNAILGWLPENTETVLVAQESFTIKAGNPHMEEHDALTTAHGYSLGLIGAADKGALFRALEGRTIRFALFGARMFANHPPGPHGNLPLGFIAYEGCAVYAFTQPVSDVEFFRQSNIMINGKPVTLARGMQRDRLSDEEEEDTYFFTLLEPYLILACNNRDFFEILVARMTTRGGQQAFPPSLPEWREVDRSAPVWAIRRFLPQRGGLDPSHPHSPRGGMAGIEDKSATGLVMQVGRDHSVKGRWLSTSKADPWRRLAENSEFGGKAKSHRRPDGIWELDIRGEGNAGRFGVLVLMARLGFLPLI